MKPHVVSAAFGLMALAPMSPVLGYSFAPARQPFVSTGEMNFAAAGFHLDCKAVFSGETEAAGGARIDAVRFTGGLFGTCRNVRPLGLPWRVKAAGRGGVVISSVHVDAPLVGECEGRDVAAMIDRSGRHSLRPDPAAAQVQRHPRRADDKAGCDNRGILNIPRRVFAAPAGTPWAT